MTILTQVTNILFIEFLYLFVTTTNRQMFVDMVNEFMELHQPDF